MYRKYSQQYMNKSFLEYLIHNITFAAGLRLVERTTQLFLIH